jgi:hypothetical protein
VGVQLDDVFPGVRARPQHGQQQHLINDPALSVYCSAMVDPLAVRPPVEPESTLEAPGGGAVGTQEAEMMLKHIALI